MRSAQDALTGEIFEEYAVLSVDELSRLCAVDRAYIVELVEARAAELEAANPKALQAAE